MSERLAHMKRSLAILLVVIFCMTMIFGCAPPKPTIEENELIEALSDIQSGLESKVSYDDYGKMLVVTKNKLDSVKTAEKVNPCFLNAATKSYQFYEICKDAWRKRDEAKDDKTRSDMDMTLTFTFGFASVSLAQAQECFEKK